MTEIAESIHHATLIVAHGAKLAGHYVTNDLFFDTIKIDVGSDKNYILENAEKHQMNFRDYTSENCIGIALDDTVTSQDINKILFVLGSPKFVEQYNELDINICEETNVRNTRFSRTSKFMENEVFKQVRSELELVRYIKELERTDLSMTHTMIPLGSCTMKLNAAAELEYLAMPEFQQSHPFAPQYQNRGWTHIFDELERDLQEITGYDKVSLQPNSGAQGEFAGLAAINAYHVNNGEANRKVCLIPTSAHGTNPASATMAGMKVQPITVNVDGSINMESLRKQTLKHSGNISSIMVTYPSTFGVFDEDIMEICGMVHEHGGQVYLDGANMNAQMGLSQPGKYGSDVSHLNLHKTFAIPHGGGGPGAGPIGVRAHLAPFLPSHPIHKTHSHESSLGTISAAPFGNAGVLPISWAMIKLLGGEGLKKSSEMAILNANYMRKRLETHYKILFTGERGMCAHEFIIDARGFKKTAGIEAVDIAKRLMDYGYHAPTMSWPIVNTLMIEPTESESKAELDRYCDALIKIRDEIAQIEAGNMSKIDNALKNAPHTMTNSLKDEWVHPYTRNNATFPADWQNNSNKFWPSVSRLNDTYGDKNLICSCPPMDTYAKMLEN
jgi:glycine dehydrogenase